MDKSQRVYQGLQRLMLKVTDEGWKGPPINELCIALPV